MAKTTVRAWAVVAKGGIAIDERNLCSLLIFDKKWRAGNAKRDHEKVIRVEIVYSSISTPEK